MVLEDGWHRLSGWCAVQVLDGVPVRVSDEGCLAESADIDAAEFELRILAKASLAFGIPLQLVAGLGRGTTGSVAIAEVGSVT